MAFFVKPTQEDCPLTGWWGSYAGHKGLDYGWLNADPGRTQQVYAAYAGTVVSVYGAGGDNGGWGNRVIIEHAPGTRTTYNHLRTGSILVSQGQHVTTGQKIAAMGATGRVTGVHLHWELYLDGVRVDPKPYREGKAIPGVPDGAVVGGNQRKVLASGDARRRAQPTTKSESKDFPLAPNEVGNFDGWTHGENVNGNDIWFRGLYSGDWFWSGGFVGGANTSGLPEIKITTPPASNQRVVGSAPMARRKGPGTQYEKADGDPLAPGETGNFVGWAKGVAVTVGGIASDIWYKGTSGDWFAAAGFTSQSTDGLPETPFDGGTTPPVNPGNILDTAYKTFTNDSALAKWIGSPNYNWRTPRPEGAKPTHVTMHWMSGTLAGTDAQFQKYTKIVDGRGDGSAATYGVGQTEIHQYVRERDYQQADGNQDSNRWGISIEHEASATNPASEAVKNLSAKLLSDLAKRYGWTKYQIGGDKTFAQVQAFAAANPTIALVFPHNHWVATQCPGTLPWQDIVGLVNGLLNTLPDPQPQPDPDTVSVPKKWLESVWVAIGKLLGK